MMDVGWPGCVGLKFIARGRFPEGNDSEEKINAESERL